MHFHARVQKARPARKAIDSLARSMASAVSLNLVKGIKRFRKRVSAEAVEHAFRTGGYGDITSSIPWDHLPEDFAPAQKLINQSIDLSHKKALKMLPPKSNILRLDVTNPRFRRNIRDNVGSMVEGIKGDTQRIIQNAVQKTFTAGWTPRDVADHISEHIGLTERQSIALSSFEQGLIDKEMPGQLVAEQVDAYNDRLLDQRSMTIARTEVRQATNQGQLSVWQEAQGQGLINPTAKKVWVVDGDPCEVCDPMDGIAVPLDGFWTLNSGDVVDLPSDSHPNCMCTMELDFGDEEE